MEKLDTVEIAQEKVETKDIKNFGDFWDYLKKDSKPRGHFATVFNVISLPIMVLGYIFIIYRLATGLASPVTNLSQEFPWGLWIGFNVVTGVAFAGGAFVLCFMVYILRAETYKPIIRVAILNGLLAYVFCALVVVFDIGRWWNFYNPIFGNYFGMKSVMFLVFWIFLLYILAALVAFFPAVSEWLGLQRWRKVFGTLALGAVIFGITLATVHQTGLGALMMMAKSKIHPLWYTQLIPVLYFVSSIFAGLALVVLEGSISYKVFGNQISDENKKHYDNILIGLAKICAVTMFGYFFLKAIVLVQDRAVHYLFTPMGTWYLIEVIGFVLVPCFMFASGAQQRNTATIQVAAALAMVGVILNRINYTFIAYNWFVPLNEKYWPSPAEIVVSASVILTMIWAFRWVINRMPVLSEPPQWANKYKEY